MQQWSCNNGHATMVMQQRSCNNVYKIIIVPQWPSNNGHPTMVTQQCLQNHRRPTMAIQQRSSIRGKNADHNNDNQQPFPETQPVRCLIRLPALSHFPQSSPPSAVQKILILPVK
jgi:hypothetical protein